MMYHIKPLGFIKTHGFPQDLNGYVFTHIKIVWTLMASVWHRAQHRYGIELKGILKNPTDFYKNHHGYPMEGC